MTLSSSPFDPAGHAPRRSWPLARVFGADLYVHWTMALVPPVLLACLAPGREPLDALAWTAVWTAVAAVVVWTHALAHLAAAGALTLGTGVVLLAPFGPLAHGAPPTGSPRTEVNTALAGPASHALWVLLAYALTFAAPAGDFAAMLDTFITVNGALAAANLLPFHPMDGGRALRGILTPRLGPLRAEAWTASAGYGGGITLGLAGLTLLLGGHAQLTAWAVALIGVGMLTLTASQRALFAAQFRAHSPTAEPAVPATNASRDIFDIDVLQRLVDEAESNLSEPALETAEERRTRLQARIDELLDRINEVGGIAGLSPDERRELSEASESLRRATAEG